MEEKPNYYAIIPANVRYDSELPPNAKLLYGEITALCNEKGYCWATNDYFATLYGVSKVSISNWISILVKKGYLSSEIIYKEGSKEILNRYLKLFNDPIKENFNTLIKENFKENNTNTNNNKLNEFNLYNNFDEDLQCESISKSTNERCQRKSSFNINGINYCNQHAKYLIPNIENSEIKQKRTIIFKKPTIEEIKEYCIERNNNIDAEEFYDFYESKGWVVGKSKMKDWKSAVRNWERNDKRTNNKKMSNIENNDRILNELLEKY